MILTCDTCFCNGSVFFSTSLVRGAVCHGVVSRLCQGHPFCFKCIHKWAAQRNDCPICRAAVKQIVKTLTPKEAEIEKSRRKVGGLYRDVSFTTAAPFFFFFSGVCVCFLLAWCCFSPLAKGSALSVRRAWEGFGSELWQELWRRKLVDENASLSRFCSAAVKVGKSPALAWLRHHKPVPQREGLVALRGPLYLQCRSVFPRIPSTKFSDKAFACPVCDGTKTVSNRRRLSVYHLKPRNTSREMFTSSLRLKVPFFGKQTRSFCTTT